MSPATRRRRLDDLELQLKGLVHVRALLETHGASPADLALHSTAIEQVRGELARLAPTGVSERGYA